ncbi:MAG: hypothetical protein JWM11_6258 [Planctomycetaceae bacterium]|nr:hypothetical protein [Planctomycetaceae bacterium]
MSFRIEGDITGIEVIARNNGIRSLGRLKAKYGPGRWRKLKGFARVRLSNGKIRRAELHWYEANGIGKVDFKIKQFID